MPNWCDNSVRVRHIDPEQLARFKQAFKAGTLLNEFVPIPPDQEENWYSWRIENWGTKWDVGGTDFVIEPLTDDGMPGLQAYFDSAWGPPIEAYQRMSEQGFHIEATYYEPGIGFVGEYTTRDGASTYEYEYTLDSVKDNVPEHLDEIYGISEQIEADSEEESA